MDPKTKPAAAASTTLPKKRIILVEDHPVTRAGVAAMLSQTTDLEVCGQADSVATGLELIEQLKPDIVIVDISLKTTNGIELVKQLKTSKPDLPALVMSMHDEILYAERALRAGARGYIMKQEASESIVEAVRRVLANELYLSAKMREKMLHRLAKKKHGEPVTYAMDTLSSREMEVFLLIGNGHSTRQIAQILEISAKTVDSYREHLKEKLQMSAGADLVYHAIQWVKSEHILS